MDDKRPQLIASEEKNQSPILIIDKKGTMGELLAKQFSEQFLTVLVSSPELELYKNIIHVPYRKKVPVIPDNHYSHMFVFYNGENEILDILPAFIKKVNATNSKLFFITSLPYSSAELFRKLENHDYHNMQVLVYGELFDEKLNNHNIVSHFLHQAQKFNRIEIPNNGVGKLYPIFIDDVFTAIISTAFATEKKRIALLFPNHAVSELSIARMLQKKNPLLKLDFKKHKEKFPSYFIPKGHYFYPEYPLEERLQNLMHKFRTPEVSHKKHKWSLSKQKRKFNPSVFWLALVLLFVAPILTAILAAVSGAGALQVSVREIEKGNLIQAKQYAGFAGSSLSVSEAIVGSLFYLDPIFSKQKNNILHQINLGKQLAETEVDVLNSLNLLEKITQNKSANPKSDFLQVLASVKKSLVTIQKMRVEGDLPRAISNKIASLESVLLPFENTIDTLPVILGFEGKRKYLVLFQNNMELRPGGGFIGSYGILEMENGAVKQFKVSDIYDADGKLTIHVEPPYALRRYMGAAHWFLRDSNFAVDFPQNAKQAETFLNFETGDKVDGVMAVDTTFLKNILAAIGPVEVADYKETVTADNFYLLTQNHAEKDFFPGSTQKKDFLRALLSTLQEKLAEKKGINYQSLVSKIGESIMGKHLFFAFSDESTQQVFRINDLSASLWDGRLAGGNKFLDYFGVIDANLGANKANYYLKRSIDQKVVLNSDGTLQTTATITYSNLSKRDSPFGGDYKNYLRFILPTNAKLKQITIDDVKQPTIDAVTDPELFTAKNFVAPKELEIDSSREEEKDIIGFLLLVPRNSSKKVVLTYAVKANDPSKNVFSYDLHVFKQPGTDNDAYSFNLIYPAIYRLVSADEKLSDVGGKLMYSGVLSEDQELRAEFSKK